MNVHYDSSRPARLQALAYTQGADIHVAPGQEQHLAHEAWHTVQQMQGRVKPTMQAKGMSINDDVCLEREADVMGARARRLKPQRVPRKESSVASNLQPPVQRMAAAKVPLQQTGGTCGLYSLGMAISGVDSTVKNEVSIAPLMTDILTQAVEVGTFVGEYMDADNLSEVASKVGYSSKVVDFGDESDMKSKLQATGSDGVLMGYSAFEPRQLSTQGFKGLENFQHLFSHWSVVEAMNNNELDVRDPGSPKTVKKMDVGDFYRYNQAAYHASGKFDFGEFESKVVPIVGQSVSDLRTLFERQLPTGVTPKGTHAALPTPLPSVTLNLKGKIVTVGKKSSSSSSGSKK